MAKTNKDRLSLDELLEQAVVKEKDRPYEVPKNWVWCTLGNSTILRRGASPRPINNYIIDDEDGVNWIKIGDTDDGKYLDTTKQKITSEGAKKSVYLESGSLILSNSMSFGRPYILGCDGCIHDGWLAVTFYNEFILKEYMYYVLLSSRWYFEQVAVGTAVRNLNIERVAGMPFPLTPLAEQQRIVAIIESLFEKLDRAKELAQNALDSFENRKSAMLHKAFTGELTSKWREENGVDFDSWKANKLKNIAEIISGTNFKSEDFSQRNVVSCVKITNVGVGYFDDENVDYLPSDFLADYQKQIVKCNDVLIALTRPFINAGLKTCIYKKEKESLLNQRVALIRGENGQYIYHYLQTSVVLEYIKEKSKTTNQPNLSIKDLEKLQIPCPTIAEQQEIVRILDHLLDNEQKAKELCDVIDKIDYMKKSILARAFRGKLGTNNPEEESALELLKEVLKDKIK